jgi:hypothetical protein
VNADDQKFGYAAIFCGLTTLIGVLISVGPVILDVVGSRILQRRPGDKAGEVEKGTGQEDSEAK